MASVRMNRVGVRVLAAAAAAPLAVALFSGVAAADNGAFAGDESNAAVATISGSGVDGANSGISSTTQQTAVGDHAHNENNSIQVNGGGPVYIDQSRTVFIFAPLW